MILVTVASLSQLPLAVPAELRTAMVPVLGVMLGAGFHPGLFDELGAWLATVAILPFYLGAALGTCYVIYRKIGGYDPVTAYFCSAPGGLVDMLIAGTEAGGNESRIALAHACRILVVVGVVSLGFAFLLGTSAVGAARPYVALSEIPMSDLFTLLICAVLGSYLAPRLSLPAPHLLGPMILSGAVHLSAITAAPPPTLLVNAAQLTLGTAVGCRFLGLSPRQVGRDFALSALVSVCMLLVTALAATIIGAVSGISEQQAFLGLAPGGLAEMSILSLAVGGDVAYVGAMHILRLTMVIATARILFRLLGVGRKRN